MFQLGKPSLAICNDDFDHTVKYKYQGIATLGRYEIVVIQFKLFHSESFQHKWEKGEKLESSFLCLILKVERRSTICN